MHSVLQGGIIIENQFSNVLTVCLNPSLDVTVWIDEIDFNEPCFSRKERIYPGGKGINVARALTRLGVPAEACSLAGEDNMKMMSRLLEQEQVTFSFCSMREKSIRENLTLVMKNGEVLKINRAGPDISEAEVQQLMDLLLSKVDSHSLLIFAGSLPPGISSDRYREMILHLRGKGTAVAVDTAVFSPEDYQIIRPEVIKPNRVELEKIFGRRMLSLKEIADAAKQLSKAVKHVLVSLGGEGLLYTGQEKSLLVRVPRVEVKSTIGAGDSTLSGFLYGLYRGMSTEESVRFAAAVGTASVLCDGTEIASPELIEKIHSQIFTEDLF